VMRNRSVTMVMLAALAAVVLGACAPTSKAVLAARAAEYPRDDVAEVFAAARAAMVEEGYAIEFEDPERGILVSEWRWYSKEGMAKPRDNARIRGGDALFRIGVQLAVGPKGGVAVKVDGAAQGHLSGASKARPYKRGAADEPPWVQGRIDGLAVSIHQKLQGKEIAPAAATK